MAKMTKAQERILGEFQDGAKVRQGNLTMERPDGTRVKYQVRTLVALINRRLVWVNPTDTTYWVRRY